jgi:hypothetical protein
VFCTTVCVPAAQVKLNYGVHGPDVQSSCGASASRWSCACWTQARASAAASEDILSYRLSYSNQIPILPYYDGERLIISENESVYLIKTIGFIQEADSERKPTLYYLYFH